MAYQDIMVGRATVPAHADGGWALPGGNKTGCAVTALEAAVNLDEVITDLEAKREPVEPTEPPRIVNRVVSDRNDPQRDLMLTR